MEKDPIVVTDLKDKLKLPMVVTNVVVLNGLKKLRILIDCKDLRMKFDIKFCKRLDDFYIKSSYLKNKLDLRVGDTIILTEVLASKELPVRLCSLFTKTFRLCTPNKLYNLLHIY